MAPNKPFLKRLFPLCRQVIFRADGSAYLIRWRILHARSFHIYLHKFLSSDEGCPHDHPWSFTSIMLWGNYMEWTFDEGEVVACNMYRAPCIIRRGATHSHKIIIHKPCWTLVITSRYVRTWGFHTKRGWVKYSDYTPKKICE